MTIENPSDGWETVVCPCGTSRSSAVAFRTGTRCYVRCEGCGLVFLNPRRPAQAVVEYYRHEYDRAYGKAEAGLDRLPAVRSVLRHLSHHRTPPGRLLDVGCGDGQFLELCMKEGWTVFGVELSQEAAARAAARGVRMLPETWLEQHGLSPEEGEGYDVVTLINVLETLPHPGAALRRIRETLVRDGIVVFRVQNGVFHLAVRRGAWWIGARYLQAFHLFIYTPGVLKTLLWHAGLKPVSIRNSAPSWAPLIESERTARRTLWRLAGLGFWGIAQVAFFATAGRAVWAPSFEVVARPRNMSS